MKKGALAHSALLLLNLFIILYWYFSFDGFYFFDDLAYAKNAIQLIYLKFSFADYLFSQRLVLIGATAISYYFFGLSDFATILPPLVCTLITCNAIYFFLVKKGYGVALMAASVYALDFYTIFFSNKLYPDVLVSCFVFLGLVALYKARKNAENTFLKAGMVVLCLYTAFLSKLTVLYIFPFLLGLAINDVIKKQNIRCWMYVLVMGIVVGGCYLYWQYSIFGDYLFRFKTIVREGHYISNDSYFDKNWPVLLRRITYQPIGMLLHSSMIIPLGLAVPGLLGYRGGKFWQHTSFEKYWVCAAFSILLYFWWGSTSWQYYNPIALFQRHLLLVVPPLAVLSGLSLERVKENAGLYALVFAGIALSGMWVNAGLVVWIYVLIFGVFALYGALQYFDYTGQRCNELAGKVFFSALLCILFIHPVYTMMKPSESGYAYLTEMVKKLEEEAGDVLLITDGQIAANCAYVFRNWKEKPVCMNFSDFSSPALLSDFEKVYVLTYAFHLPAYRNHHDNLMKILEENAIQLQPTHSIGNVHVFRLDAVQGQTF